jgi:hypothetical protein
MGWSLPTLAADSSTSVPPAFLTCYGIQQTGERLACYDRAVEYLRQSDEKVAAPSAETSFGLQGRTGEPRKNDAASAKPEQTESVTARVSAVVDSRGGLKIITLDNGQTWRQLTSSNSGFLDVGDEVTVNRAALGSFLMHVPNGAPLRVRRVK